MTRINLVPVSELCDQHLLAEHREITRIPSCLYKGILKYEYPDRPKNFTLGKGHVKFFTNKLGWLLSRYNELGVECFKRGFNVTRREWDQPMRQRGFCFEDWTPDDFAISISRARITEKMPKKARYYGKPVC
jgi:deoxyribonuclease (pyrimidine dimer)